MQLQFVYDTQYCTGCKACQVACKDCHGLETGLLYRRVLAQEGGSFEPSPGGGYVNHVFARYQSVSCFHCADPVCMSHCPAGAITKKKVGFEEAEAEIVVLESALCIGCGLCKKLCPHDAPVFNRKTGRMEKCDFCAALLEKGELPACVNACPLRLIHVSRSISGGQQSDAL